MDRPPDQTGRDTFARFRYQAHVAFRFCLNCVTSGEVRAVIPEFYEDLALEVEPGYRFIQIKTRDPERLPWRLSHLLADGGALVSLLRSHRAVEASGFTGQVRYEARLEGHVARDDDLAALTTRGEGATDQVCERCADALGMSIPDAREFLERVEVFDREPPRDVIVDRNIRLLGLAARGAAMDVIERTYRRVLERIERAMEGGLTRDSWPGALLETNARGEELERALESQRLSREELAPLFEELIFEQGFPLLRRATDPSQSRASALEEKLLAAGASSTQVGHAAMLRASAESRLYALEAASPSPEIQAQIEDLLTRVKVVADSVGDLLGGGDTPAVAVWDRLRNEFHSQRDMLDSHNLLYRDPMLLLGAVCTLSDRCEYRWGA